MAVVAEFTADTVDFALDRVFEAYPEATVELDRVVPTDEAFLPYFWVWDADVDGVAEAVSGAKSPTEVGLVDRVDGGGLFRARWLRDFDGLIERIERSGLTLQKAVGSRENWLFEFRAERVDDLSEFQRYLADADAGATLVRLHELDDGGTTGRYNLTAPQREALLLAYDEGYYETPTRTDLESLAAKLGISRSAVSARLKRAYGNLVEATVAHEQAPDDA